MKKNNYLRKLILAGSFLALCLQAHAQDANERTKIKKEYDLVKLGTIQEKFKKKEASDKLALQTLAKANNWVLQKNLPDGRFIELQKVVNGKPIYYTTFNIAAAKSTRANHLNSGGSLGLSLDGQNMTAHVWDGGLARITHQEYDGSGGTNRFSIGDGTTAKHYHSAHVTGTIIASGVQANAKGMASRANAVGYDWNNDTSEATTAAANGMLISNHSYGYAGRNAQGQPQLPNYYYGAYISDSRDWDELMFNAPNYLMVVAAGNDGNDNTVNSAPLDGNSLYDKLTGHSTAKNNLVVANAQDANIDASGNLVSVTINSSSSEGPTDDYRIKPDITGNGTGVYSTYENSDTAYNSITGTSMASPNVAGSLLLLQEHYKNLNNSFMKAATLKGLALHTADDAGTTGPDAVFGWGLMHAKRAAEAISDHGTTSKVEELTLTSGQTYTITVDSDGVNPLLASISWTDRAGIANTGTENLATPVLVNDLDIRVSKAGTTYMPYKLTSITTNTKADNNVDPYERVDVANASGTYTITVTHKGSLTGSSQNFSLIVTGIGAAVTCVATTPTGLNASSVTGNGAVINWTAVPGVTYDVRYRVVGSSSWTTTAVSTPTLSLNSLTAETNYEVQVRSKCTSSNSAYTTAVNFTTSAIQLNYCTSKGNSVADEYIGRVQLGAIDNSSNGGNGYSDHTSISTSLIKGSANTITITPTWTGRSYNEGYGVWIDYNQDGDFSDANEQVWTKSKSKSTPVSTSFTIPASANDGATRMRVVMKYNATPTACEASFSYGEVEDYTVVITAAEADIQAPSVPIGLVASNITQTTATLTWNASTDNVGVKDYEVFNGNTSLGTVTGTTTSITGLVANTNYSYSVKSRDEAGNVSLASASISFTTLAAVLNYCTTKGSNSSYEWIDYVSFGGMTNTTGNNGGYADFTNKTATVAKGATSTIVFSAGFSSSSYSEFWSVWIDFNQNGIFEASERVVNGSSSLATNLSATIAIPSTALTGITRMRVTMKYNSAATTCETFNYGEVEDYSVNITNTATSLNTTFASVKADEIGNEAAEVLSVYPNPTSDYIKLTLARGNDLSYSITNFAGQVVKTGKVSDEMIDVSALRNGVYVVQVNDGQKEITTKLVKK